MAVAAVLVLAVHLAWFALVIFGTLWTSGRPLWSAIHIVALLWGIVAEVGPWPCPLTLAEQYFEAREFQIGEIQSEMRASDPNFLVLSYTRTMVTFTLFHQEPKRIAMIGLDGGSMPKWCYHQLLATDITVIEISAMVISLREHFYIPADDERLRVICEMARIM